MKGSTGRLGAGGSVALSWKMGVEIELMTPAGASRRDLALRVAQRHGGMVRRFFHPQSEPSEVPGTPVFENLTLGFEALDANGKSIATFVDDLTLQADLNKQMPPVPGWYRVIADDGRLLRLVMRHCDAEAPLETLLDPFAALFGTKPQVQPSGMVRIVDDRGASVAICAPLPGERERPCEIVTAPIERNHEQVLADLLYDACEEGCSVPLEGATHIHFDATPLLSARVLAVLVETLWTFGDQLKQLVGANENCVRLGRWPEALPALVRTDAFQALEWQAARAAMSGLELTKYCDFNLLNIAAENRAKHTFEVRVLPSWLEPEPIVEAAALFEALLRWCVTMPTHKPGTLAELLDALPMPEAVARSWRAQLAERVW